MEPYEFTKPKPVPAANEVLVKVEASIINPSDNLFVSGRYFKQLLPTNYGFEGCGRVEAVGSEALNDLIEKRVSFQTSADSWAEYSTSSTYFVIDEDAVASAASGICRTENIMLFKIVQS